MVLAERVQPWTTRDRRLFNQREVERFVTKVLPLMAEGHEVLTRAAARGLPGIPVSALIAGVRRVDTGGSLLNTPRAMLSALDPAEQKRHALRKCLCQPTRTALEEIRQHLMALHRRVLSSAASPSRAFEWAGEALHLIQDSYSRAHMDRAFGTGPGGTHPIRYIRFFGFVSRFPPRTTEGPLEHNFPTDKRDQIKAAGGGMTPEGRVAIAASHEFLRLIMAHLRAPADPAVAPQLHGFLNRHFVLAPRYFHPGNMHSFCRA